MSGYHWPSTQIIPVGSFENYIAHLNPKINSLWQVPINKFKNLEKQVWYMPVQLGHIPIEKFMGRISEACQLTELYTNHCIRVTGATNLTRSGKFTVKQIISITGHKSLQSLPRCQRVHSDEKLMMGMNPTYCLYHPTEVEEIQEIIQKMIDDKSKGTSTHAKICTDN